jgi:hypothetical protein
LKAPLNETDEERMIRLQMEALAADEKERQNQVSYVLSMLYLPCMIEN